MDPRVNMIMTSTRDVAGIRKFYEEGLGWTVWGPVSEYTVTYKVGTAIMVFLNADYQAQQSGLPYVSGPKSMWAVFLNSAAEVDEVFARALKAGATQTSPIQDRDDAVYSGYFTDPEGNAWEVCYCPHLLPGPDGSLTLPG